MPVEQEKPPQRVKSMLRNVDQLLRGGFTRDEDLRQGRIAVPVEVLGWSCLVMGAAYGLIMGLFSATGDTGSGMPFYSVAFSKIL